MAQVICEVSPGLRASERTVVVRNLHGSRLFLRVEEDFLAQVGAHYYLPVGVVGIDAPGKLALVELPHEADSGVSRLWVRFSDLRGVDGIAP